MSSHQSLLPPGCAPHPEHLRWHGCSPQFRNFWTNLYMSIGKEPFVNHCVRRELAGCTGFKINRYWNGANFRCGSSGAWESRCAQTCSSQVFLWGEIPSCEMVVRASTLHQEQPRCGRRGKHNFAQRWKRFARTLLCGCYCQRVEVATLCPPLFGRCPLFTFQPAKTLV